MPQDNTEFLKLLKLMRDKGLKDIEEAHNHPYVKKMYKKKQIFCPGCGFIKGDNPCPYCGTL